MKGFHAVFMGTGGILKFMLGIELSEAQFFRQPGKGSHGCKAFAQRNRVVIGKKIPITMPASGILLNLCLSFVDQGKIRTGAPFQTGGTAKKVVPNRIAFLTARTDHAGNAGVQLM